MQSRDKSIVIGTGKIAQSCALMLLEKSFEVTVLEFSKNGQFTNEPFSKINNIDYRKFSQNEELTSYFEAIDSKTLVVSASNRFIFNERVLSNINLEIINYHSSLLPKYPGRNAESWAIFEDDDYAGITWHKVVRDIDAGEIIYQEKIKIDDTTTSIYLLKEFSKLAVSSFDKIINDYLGDGINYYPQNGYDKSDMKYSWVKPSDGVLDIDWSEKKISRFLRCFDYGVFMNLGEYSIPSINASNLYYYKIHKKDCFEKKFKNSFVIEKENLIFEIKKND